ncbi:MAG: hypothetical protein V4510_03770 [bacterium]
MRGKSMICLLALGVFIFASLPATNAQVPPTCEQPSMCPNKSTPTTLYFHIFDTFNAFPINTQVPQPDGFFKVGGTNFPTIDDKGQSGQANYDFNTIYGFATSGPVEYNFIENGQPRFHPERGIARDVVIDPKVTPYAYIYVDVRDFLGTNSDPNLLPKFTVRLYVRDGNVIGPDSNLDANPTIMQGIYTAYLWSEKSAPPFGESVQDPNCNNPDEPSGTCKVLWSPTGIIEYKIKLNFVKDPSKPLITKADAYNVHLDWYQDPDGTHPDQFSEGYMRLVSTNVYHPRIVMAINNPVYMEFIHPEVAAGILLIHTAENSPWGTYDIDVQNMTVEVTGPSTPRELPVVVAQNSHVHNLHDKPAEVTYLWRFRADDATVEGGGAKEGDYKIHVTVQNRNHTATASGDASFHVDARSAYGVDEGGRVVVNTITEEGGKSSPGAGLLVIVVLVGGAIVIRRRV